MITARCPGCNRKGLHFTDHPHAYGYKDRATVECRFCLKRYATESLYPKPDRGNTQQQEGK